MGNLLLQKNHVVSGLQSPDMFFGNFNCEKQLLLFLIWDL